MKLHNIFTSAMCLLASAAMMSSCINDNKENNETYQQQIPGTINVVFDGGSLNPTYTTGVSYLISYNFTTFKSNVTVTGLSIGGNSFPALELKDLSWTAKDGWRTISAPSAQASSTVVAPTFQNFELGVYDRMVTTNSYYPCMNIQYTVNGNKIYGFPGGIINIGETKVIDSEGNVYEQPKEDRSLYVITLYTNKSGSVPDLNVEANRKANLNIENAKFADKMPAMNMLFPNIPYNVKPNGVIEMEVDELEPSLVGSDGSIRPYEGAKIKNLTCRTDAQNNMTLIFTCELTMKGATTTYQTVVTCVKP